MKQILFSDDFKKSDYTAIISDLHLCEAEPIHSKFPLWKKFKTKEFFYDTKFQQFLEHIQKQAHGNSVELILNGDIFDFDSVVALPDRPPYRISWLEASRGMFPQEPKSLFKIQKIIEDHPTWFAALSDFVKNGNRAVFVIGNHDLELHYLKIQAEIVDALKLNDEEKKHVRFNEWFYVSNGDSVIEHGNQYDPYCVCQNPVNPLIQKYNQIEIRLPFGNLASRYMINGMGFFNPHADSNYIMSSREYLNFFTNYLLKSQPFIIWAWFWGAMMTLLQSFTDRLRAELKDPLTIEDKVNDIARRANATPRMVRELAELRVHPASSDPMIIARELWLDRALLVVIAFVLTYILFMQIKLIWNISLFWMFIPLFLYFPFFTFYAKSITPKTVQYKEPKERILSIAGQITNTRRVIYGHTHVIRHEWVGEIEHLNSGTWSPAFLDVECTRPVGKKAYVWLEPGENNERRAGVYEFLGTHARPMFGGMGRTPKDRPRIRYVKAT
ncbi:MAG: metallophosphoesterase [Bdellovibrionales bacterium]